MLKSKAMLEFTRRIMLLGAPGVGKGSYASKSSSILQIPHLTTGDMIREEISRGTEAGEEFESYTKAGKLVPDDLVVGMIMGQLKNLFEQGSGFILDGFPRNIPQAQALKESEIPLDLVVNLTQDEEVIVKKIINRRVCSNCGANYNYAHIKFDNYEMPPLVPKQEGICDDCGGKDTLIQRDDDKEEVVRNRLVIYESETAPLIEYYKKEGNLVEFPIVGGTKQLLPEFLKILEGDI